MLHSDLTGAILSCCFEVMKELGPGFLERVYKNALLIVMKQKGLQVEVERPYEVIFRRKVMGRYNADLVVGQTVIVELIPFPGNNVIFELRESSRDSTIANGSISMIWTHLRSLNPEALTRSNMTLFPGNGIKCCDSLIREHQAQLFNYLKVADLPIGLLVNFRRRKDCIAMREMRKKL